MALTKVSNTMLVQPVNHNILINPAFTVKQRGDVIDHTNTSFGPDRWVVRGFIDTGGTVSQSTTVIDPTTGINKLVVKHRNATSASYTYQNIETVNLLGLYGKEMTLSFSYSDTGGSGIPKARFASYNSSNTLEVIEEVTPTSLGNGRWTCTSILSTGDGTIPDPSGSGLQVVIYPNEGNTAPAEWSVWETKLEVGPVATPFIARSYGEELALCQRYFLMLTSKGTVNTNGTLIGMCLKYSSDTITFGSFPVEMRVVPSLAQAGATDSIDIRMTSKSLKIESLNLDPDTTPLSFRLGSGDYNISSAPDGSAGWTRLLGSNTFISFDAEL